MLLSIIYLLFSLTNYDLSPIYGIIGLFLGIIIAIIGYGLIADSPQETLIQAQESKGETVIVRQYDKNENLINEWRVEK